MTLGRDDALAWDGDDDPTLDVGSRATESHAVDAEASRAEASVGPVLPEGFTAVGKGSEQIGRIEHDDAAPPADEPAPVGDRPAFGNGMLVALGVMGGIYLLYTIGWIIGGLRLQGQREYLVSDVMFQGSFWLAVLAPALWFAAVFALTRRHPTWVRVAWLVAGVVLLVPWPFIMTGAVGV